MLFSSVGDGHCEDVSCVVSILVALGFAVPFILMLSTCTIVGSVVGLTSEQYTSSKGHKNNVSRNNLCGSYIYLTMNLKSLSSFFEICKTSTVKPAT